MVMTTGVPSARRRSRSASCDALDEVQNLGQDRIIRQYVT
jgi:hypothetical protein